MAIEERRGCGYRKVGGLYLCGGGIMAECDRLPLRVGACPVCGGGIHFTRSFVEVKPLMLFGSHEQCRDTIHPCYVCDPTDDAAYIMMVGRKFYTPESFLKESMKRGVSKRIPFIPKNMQLGKTVVYLAHPEAATVATPAVMQQAMTVLDEATKDYAEAHNKPRLLEAEKVEKALGIFMAFIPERVEMPIFKSKLTKKKRKELEARGITPVEIPDGDKDHK